MKKFKITVDAIGRGKVEIDGQDISRAVTGFQIAASCKGDELTTIVLHGIGELEMEGEAVIVVSKAADLADIINTLNVESIEEEALSRGGWGQTKTNTQLIIDVIMERLRAIES